jgi:hypothetical protein
LKVSLGGGHGLVIIHGEVAQMFPGIQDREVIGIIPINMYHGDLCQQQESSLLVLRDVRMYVIITPVETSDLNREHGIIAKNVDLKVFVFKTLMRETVGNARVVV